MKTNSLNYQQEHCHEGSIDNMMVANVPTHPWQVTPHQAVEIQRSLATRVLTHDEFSKINFVCGVDVGFEQQGAVTRAAAVLLDFPALTLREYSIAKCKTTFPYVPGLLSFREVPAILNALEKLSTKPQMILCDGQGYAHPRRLGIACHLGVLTDIPCIGVGKSRLLGTYDFVPNQKGAWVPLMDKNEIVGAVLRTRVNVKPLFISIGHKICLQSAVEWVLRCTTRYKLPETTRWAHKIASREIEVEETG